MPRPVITRLNDDKITQNTAGPRVIHGEHLTNKCFAKVDRTHRPICTPSLDQLTLTMAITAEMTGVLGSMDVEVFDADEGPAETVLSLTVEPPRAARAVEAAAAVAAPPRIGILSSIEFTNRPVERAFRLGLGHAWEFVPEVDIGYDRGLLEAAADRLLALNPKPNLIVSFGGNIVARVLASKATADGTKFMCVLGDLTPEISESPWACGGINLDTVARNAERFNYLTRELNIPASQICFLSNPSSAMAHAEQRQWLEINPPGRLFLLDTADYSTAGKVDRNRFREALRDTFREFARDGACSVMLVSADPLFQQFKDELIAAANLIHKKVCYPLQAYGNKGGGAQPASGRHSLHGPKLARECFFLGRDAATVVVGSTAMQPRRLPFRVPQMFLDAVDDES